ncbi:MAG: hypothetical protein A2W98_02245 [Bacteroidetes bacterium GWF2_33_38]|nr:MAG: hypothetical protein A2W98_02245 [Bacteroidetes bacterium GWF2_33_38]OFY73811.1 MAG: hypothetical protein A2265_00865 [Bacteroidetes bacterium RIFOXYA12_FULL_33_9]OFY89412.1 MAG: hypothetical protein A2236_14075 [Bacteroidetes bacterium RIFOXYA2_FULL_33_7]
MTSLYYSQKIIFIGDVVEPVLNVQITYGRIETRFIPIKHQNVAYFHFVLYACFALISVLTIVVPKFL